MILYPVLAFAHEINRAVWESRKRFTEKQAELLRMMGVGLSPFWIVGQGLFVDFFWMHRRFPDNRRSLEMHAQYEICMLACMHAHTGTFPRRINHIILVWILNLLTTYIFYHFYFMLTLVNIFKKISFSDFCSAWLVLSYRYYHDCLSLPLWLASWAHSSCRRRLSEHWGDHNIWSLSGSSGSINVAENAGWGETAQ